jgi:sarcosine oxidase subunit alpha
MKFRTDSGGRVRRDRPVVFRFDGKQYRGFEGDTLASALLANGVHLVARSFKYHRPRGIFSAGSEEPNALVTVLGPDGRTTPNLRATQVELHDGLSAASQNRFPSLRLDLGRMAAIASPLLAAGFYYKTFMWPRPFWRRLYEPAIRRAAGLGRAPRAADPDRYAHQYAHCDVLVVGAGPAGLAAAMAASSSGARVILCDEQAELGGSLLAEDAATIDGLQAADWLARAVTTLQQSVTLLPRTTAFGWYPDNMVGLVQRVTDHIAPPAGSLPRERLWLVRAGQIVLATGAIQRPLVFPGNDRPGIMLAEAGRIYVNRYGVKPGSNVVVATAEDSAYRAALALHEADVPVAGIVDRRPDPSGDLVAAVQRAGLEVHTATEVTATEGRLRIHTAKLSGATRVLPCDTLLTSGGWTPSVHLWAQAKAPLRFDDRVGAFVPAGETQGMLAAGACAGLFDLAGCLEQGDAAGTAAVRSAAPARGFAVSGLPALACGCEAVPASPHRSSGPKAFVDLQNDVTTRDLATALQEGFRSVEHVKRYTTLGMGTDQGKTSNLNGLVALSVLRGQPVPEIGLTTYRPPFTPVTFGALAGAARGRLFEPLRLAPTHAWAEAQGAIFEDVGHWRRARAFPRPGEDLRGAVARECRAVRTTAGLFDASTLGKIEVVGPDAGLFLDRLYTGGFSRLAPGRCRYGVMLGEDGFIRDDGVIARLAHDRYHLTTTTGGAASVLHHMEDYLQTEFPELRAWLTSTTEHWAVIALQGPRAPEILAPLAEGIAVGTMPHMSVREGTVAGIPARVFRVSFTGEVGFEINVPSDHAQELWNALLQAGAAFEITPYGTESMHILRAEVGFILVGQETDGTVTPDDAGLGWTIGRGKSDFVGKRSLARPEMRNPRRKQLVGLLTADPGIVLEEGAPLVATPNPTIPATMLGHVTSAYRSEAVGRSIALALLSGGRARIGETLHVPLPGQVIAVTVTEPRFLASAADRPRSAATYPAHSATSLGVLGRDGGSTAERAQARRHPLHALAATSPSLELARLTALAPTTRISVRGDNAAATTIGRALGVILGSAPNRAVVSLDRAALWLGPDEWLVLAPEHRGELVRQAQVALGSMPGSVVDVSHRSTSIELAGSYGAWCLNGFCPLDLHPAAFPVGTATRTVLGKAEIVLWRTDTDSFHIEVARSFAPYIWECLEEARLELQSLPA